MAIRGRRNNPSRPHRSASRERYVARHPQRYSPTLAKQRASCADPVEPPPRRRDPRRSTPTPAGPAAACPRHHNWVTAFRSSAPPAFSKERNAPTHSPLPHQSQEQPANLTAFVFYYYAGTFMWRLTHPKNPPCCQPGNITLVAVATKGYIGLHNWPAPPPSVVCKNVKPGETQLLQSDGRSGGNLRWQRAWR